MPLSPVIRMVEAELRANFASTRFTETMAGDSPMILSSELACRARIARTSRRRAVVSSAFAVTATTCSMSKGLATKSKAPSRIASTARSTEEKAVSNVTGTSASISRMRLSSVNPSVSGRR
ncbi:MAG: hypothetical protein R3B82_11740 [Sandaracinaceae bacterium]